MSIVGGSEWSLDQVYMGQAQQFLPYPDGLGAGCDAELSAEGSLKAFELPQRRTVVAATRQLCDKRKVRLLVGRVDGG